MTSQSCNGGRGVAFSVGQSQCFSGSRLLQQEVCDLAEPSPRSKMQQRLVRFWRTERNARHKNTKKVRRMVAVQSCEHQQLLQLDNAH